MANAVTGFNGAAPAGLLPAIGAFMPIIMFKVTISGTTTSEAITFAGLAAIHGAIIQVLDSGNNVATTDVDVTWSGNVLTLADGSTFNLDASGHNIYGVVWGKARA